MLPGNIQYIEKSKRSKRGVKCIVKHPELIGIRAAEIKSCQSISRLKKVTRSLKTEQGRKE